MAEVALAAEHRRTQGSPASRRLRASGKIPAVLYGHGIEPLALAVEARALRLALNTDAGVNALVDLDVEGQRHLALTREIQRHPVRGTVNHVDFLVVSRNEAVQADIPITFIGDSLKVTRANGVVEHPLTSLTVNATPATLPSHIEVDLTDLEIDGAVRVKDIVLPDGVTTDLDPEETVAVARMTRAAISGEGDGESEADAGASDGAAASDAQAGPESS